MAESAEKIRCPACSYLFDPEDSSGLITYHGENGPQDVECPNCETAMSITEHVSRTYEVELFTEGADS